MSSETGRPKFRAIVYTKDAYEDGDGYLWDVKEPVEEATS